MIIYPAIHEKVHIGVTAPSSGVEVEKRKILEEAITRMEEKGYTVTVGETSWKQERVRSAPAMERAKELNQFLQDKDINLIFPPFGGELLIEILEYIEFDKMNPKWVLGYSDTSLLLFVITLKTGIATAHGTNLVDLRGKFNDETTKQWINVLKTKKGGEIIQYSSDKYQKNWNHDHPSPYVFHLTEPTIWKPIGVKGPIKGRLLGGCIDVIRHVIGTSYGDVRSFQEKVLNHEPIIWYLENCELLPTDVKRSLVQMKLAGWFDHCNGILFGRTPVEEKIKGYGMEDVYKELQEELNIPVIYDIDCGHQPPQITFVNGAYGEITIENGKGKVLQKFI